MLYKNVIGTLIESYYICKRQVWFIGHSIYADQSNPYIELGRLIDQSTYKNEKKQIHFENVVIDIVSRKEGEVIVGEIKKSSKAIKSATMQLAFYLKKLKDCGINLNGELLIPKEKKELK